MLFINISNITDKLFEEVSETWPEARRLPVLRKHIRKLGRVTSTGS